MTIWIQNGDAIECMRMLPNGSVTHVVTDPPYSDHVHSNMRGNRGSAGIAKREAGFEPLTQTLLCAAAREFVRIATGWIVIFSDWESINLWRAAINEAGGSYRRAIPWVRWSSPQFNRQAPPCGSEAVIVAKPIGRSRFWRNGSRTHYDTKCLRAQSLEKREAGSHATQKPLALMREIIHDIAERGDTILDPFAGSGTTGVAADAEGMNAILIERDPFWCEQMRKRLQFTVTQ